MKFSFIHFGRDNDFKRAKWLKEKLQEIPAGLSVLDAGAGQLRNKKNCNHLNYVSQDFCEYTGFGDGTSIQTGGWDTSKIDIISDISSIPVGDSSFDVVLCSEVLEHIPDPNKALAELARITRSNGLIILTAPFASLSHFAPFHYVSGLSKYWYEKNLSDLGFVIIEIRPNGSWFDFMAQEIYRAPWVGRTYSSGLLGSLFLVLSFPLLIVLRIMKSLDRGSSELLAYGWQVVARKN